LNPILTPIHAYVNPSAGESRHFNAMFTPYNAIRMADFKIDGDWPILNAPNFNDTLRRNTLVQTVMLRHTGSCKWNKSC
jgi:hypothetical protein